MDLNSEESCRQYLESQDPSTIANQIRWDQQSCRDQKLPTLLALYLPPAKSALANSISMHLSPEIAKYDRTIRLAQYQGIIHGIKGYLEGMTPTPRHEELPSVNLKGNKPSKQAIHIALDVIDFYHKSRYFKEIHNKTPLEDIIHLLQTETTATGQGTSDSFPPKETHISKTKPDRTCYICRFLLISHHAQYPSLCKPCGEFNLASCNLSLPENLNLAGRTAFITGARVNLGYHTALRMLRCGAKVIATTRYPRDAHARYLKEKDSTSWSENLRIIGADFRSAGDVFELVHVAKDCLKDWSDNKEPKLDILINNAAQTLTDPLEVERDAVRKEIQFTLESSDTGLILCDSNYEARVRGTVHDSKLLGFETTQHYDVTSIHESSIQSIDQHKNKQDDQKVSHIKDKNQKSSWMQSISQIPYEDIISAHSVNTFVPLILIRELLPIMGTSNSSSNPNSPKPHAYIINVSSREGIFEAQPTSRSKNGHHVHTNLTKAALNMITETEAEPAWRKRRVAMNTVDPGYMSAAPEIERIWKEVGREACPIGWEDGAGRVLWPIAVGEMGKEKGGGVVWGRFLKHFGGVGVDVGSGR